jgi:hypothetical protein
MTRTRVAVIAVAVAVWFSGNSGRSADAVVLDTDGAATATRLNQRLNDTRTQCEAPEEPAYHCIGVVLKGSVKSGNHHSWDLDADQTSSRTRGVRVSYLRAGAQVPWTPGQIDNGFILYPVRQTPKNRMEMKGLPVTKSDQQNEFRIERWGKGNIQALPIEAFFFMGGNLSGLMAAQSDQREFYKQTGIAVPVIALLLNVRSQPALQFVYDPTQQGEWGTCTHYIKSAVWSDYVSSRTKKKSGSQLKITPTDCGRHFPEWEADLAYTEMAREYGHGPRWKWNPTASNDTMRRQYICLRMNYSEQPTWSIETFRPYVDGVKAKEAACNP